MSNEIHAFRVWAVRSGERSLELMLDHPNGRRLAADKVTALRAEPGVDEIEVREHLVLYRDSETPTARRRTLRWMRAPSGRWYQLPDRNVRPDPAGETHRAALSGSVDPRVMASGVGSGRGRAPGWRPRSKQVWRTIASRGGQGS
jgi:hypothetical protein